MIVTGVLLQINLADPVGECEKVISYVLSQQREDQHLQCLEQLQKSISEAIGRINSSAEMKQSEDPSV